MGWFSKKQPKSADDVLVERTLAFAQEVAQEQPDDEQALLALIDGIKMMPAKPATATDTIESSVPEASVPEASLPEAPLPEAPSSIEPAPSSLLSTISLPPVSLAPVQMPASPTSPIMIADVVEKPLYPAASQRPASTVVLADVETSAPASDGGVLPSPVLAVPVRSEQIPINPLPSAVTTSKLPVTIETPPASPLPPPVLRPASPEHLRRPEPRSFEPAPKQSEMRREIAQRVQNFKAHQQRLNDEREARIKKIYADMQARLEKSGAPKSPPIS